ncbi:MAG TPA: SAM-dependent methyltransferase [Candidatus Limnocylindrales bacterium]
MTRPPRIELRRQQPAPPPAAEPGDPRLVELLRSEIEGAGPITFARFMQLALYAPGLGYYATSAERATRDGDFLTAPELHPIFGRVLARQIEEMRQRLGTPRGFVVREHGAARQVLRTAMPDGVRYEAIEHADDHSLAPMVGCILANELLDALPVHRVVMRDGTLREVYVGWRDGRFTDVEGKPSTAALGEWFAASGVELGDGQRAEACLVIGAWLARATAPLERGYVLLIDYADQPAALYGAARRDGTLRAFRGHQVGRDVLATVGRQDLTATVDLAALDRAARAAGLVHLGTTTQAEFLVGCGLEEELETERERVAGDWQAMALLRAAVARLLDPRQLGGYKVAIYGRDVPPEPPLRGLAYRLPDAR